MSLQVYELASRQVLVSGSARLFVSVYLNVRMPVFVRKGVSVCLYPSRPCTHTLKHTCTIFFPLSSLSFTDRHTLTLSNTHSHLTFSLSLTLTYTLSLYVFLILSLSLTLTLTLSLTLTFTLFLCVSNSLSLSNSNTYSLSYSNFYSLSMCF